MFLIDFVQATWHEPVIDSGNASNVLFGNVSSELMIILEIESLSRVEIFLITSYFFFPNSLLIFSIYMFV